MIENNIIGKLKEKRRAIVLISIFFIIFCFASYYWAYSGESFKVAKSYIENNIQIIESIGEINDVKIISYSDKQQLFMGTGHAEYKLAIDGKRNSGEVEISLQKNNGAWIIEKAMFFIGDEAPVYLKNNGTVGNDSGSI